MPIDVPSRTFDTVQVTKICDKQAEQDCPPDFEVRRGPKYYGFIDSEQEIHVCQLGEDDLDANGYDALGR